MNTELCHLTGQCSQHRITPQQPLETSVLWSLLVKAQGYVCCCLSVGGTGRRSCPLPATAIPFQALLTRLMAHVLTRLLEG